jgi:hypothetical protein
MDYQKQQFNWKTILHIYSVKITEQKKNFFKLVNKKENNF